MTSCNLGRGVGNCVTQVHKVLYMVVCDRGGRGVNKSSNLRDIIFERPLSQTGLKARK